MSRYRYKKTFRTQKKKSVFRFLKNKSFWIIFLIIFVFSGIMYFVFLSSFFNIKQINISGNKKIETQKIESIVKGELEKKVFLVINKNTFFVNLSKIDQLILEQFKEIKEVTLKRKLPSGIDIEIVERNPVGVWCRPYFETNVLEMETEEDVEKIIIEKNECFNLDDSGIVFEKSAELGAQFIIKSEKDISMGENVIPEEYLLSILEIKQEFQDYPNFEIKEFVYEKDDKLVVKTFSNLEIYFNFLESITEEIFNLKLVFKEKIPQERIGDLDYIDLRFGNRVYIKYIGDPVSETN